MLFGYPSDATQNNWLHEALFETIKAIHSDVTLGKVTLDWPNVVPLAHHQQLHTRPGLKARLSAYMAALARENQPTREKILQAFIDQNRVRELVTCELDCARISDLPINTTEAIKTLFEFGFKLLTELGVRDEFYGKIYQEIQDKVCPFCGCEYLDDPQAPREALDHYLAASIYPFASVNLNNLAPMGNKCNSRYKLAQDVLRDEFGKRRKSFYPFAPSHISFSLLGSELFDDNGNLNPTWKLRVEPDIEETKTWDTIFSSRERYIRDHLGPSFRGWLGEFGKWCQSANRSLDSDLDVLSALHKFSDLQQKIGLQDRAFLKLAVFKLLSEECRAGNTRLTQLMRNMAGVGRKTTSA